MKHQLLLTQNSSSVHGSWVVGDSVEGSWVVGDSVEGSCVDVDAWVVAGACVVEPAELGGVDSSPSWLMAVMYSRCALLQSMSSVPATTPSML